jgi:peptidyl-prolyl cis-trans isomerase B (cyclophilin B)
MNRLFFIFLLSLFGYQMSIAQPTTKLRKSDLKKDVLLKTDKGNIVLRLSDSTPIHRENFIKLVRCGYYEGISFHRVIAGFMIQAGNEQTKIKADSTRFLKQYTLPAEIIPSLYHKRGTLAAARTGDDVNPSKSSSGVQFYIVQGKVFNDASLDSVQTNRLKGRKLSAEHRAVYKTSGGAPQLDQSYTIFGEMVMGFDVLDIIANTETTGKGKGDKPLVDVRIIKTKMIKRS